jgi:hypothetical protein
MKITAEKVEMQNREYSKSEIDTALDILRDMRDAVENRQSEEFRHLSGAVCSLGELQSGMENA